MQGWHPLPGWTPTGVPGELRGPQGQIWRSWREFGQAAGHFANRRVVKAIGQRNAEQARRAESRFGVQLRHISRQINAIIRGIFNPIDPYDPGWQPLIDALASYQQLIQPWAEQTVRRMLADVSRRDIAGWHALSKEINVALGATVAQADISNAIRQMYDFQINKILELPANASQRIKDSRAISANIVAELRSPGQAGQVAGRRWSEMVSHIHNTGLVIQSTANTVARTETARAASIIQAVRAEHIGSPGFVWRSVGDKDVRPLHKKLNGHSYSWDFNSTDPSLPPPPLLDDNKPGLPGTIYNCRCWAEPIIPDIP